MVTSISNYRRSNILAGAVDADVLLADGSTIVASFIPDADPEVAWVCWIPDEPTLSAAITAMIDDAAASEAACGG